MTENLKKTIKEESVKLPKESQEVINTFGWEKISEEIGKKYLLNESEINDLQAEIALVLLGISEEDSLFLNIEDRVGTTKNEATKITAEINKEIFNPMLEKRETLLKNNSTFNKPNWKQTINFIVSGGNYSTFTEEESQDKKNVAYREVV